MTDFDEYFTHDDKPFAENINDALLLSNVFDMTVPIEIPTMYRDSTFANSTSQRKCGVAIVTLKESLPSGVSVSTVDGKSVLTGTGTVKLGFYPNFASFGKYTSISWTGTGSITVNLKTTGGSTIASNIANGTITSTSVELQKLQEIVIEIVLSSATLKTMTVTMQNKDLDRYGAEVGIDDVNGLDDRLSALEGEDDKVLHYRLYADNPTIDNSTTINCKVTDIDGDAVTNKSITLYKDGNAVSSANTNSNGVASWTVSFADWDYHHFNVEDAVLTLRATGFKTFSLGNGTLYYDDEKAMAVLDYHSTITWTAISWTSLDSFTTIPTGLRPKQNVFTTTSDTRLFVRVKTDGAWQYTTGGNNITAPYIQTTLTWLLP